MKTFRQPFWKAYTSTFTIPFVVIVSMVFMLLLYIVTHAILVCFMFLSIMILISCPIFFTRYCYIVLTDDQLFFKNSVYIFWSKKYFYGDIMKVEIRSGADACMKITIHEQRNFPRSYFIDLVAPEDYDELVSMIKAKEVTVIIEEVDIYWPYKELDKNQVTDNCCDTEMKIFRRSFWSAQSTKMVLIPSLLIPFLIIPDAISRFGFSCTVIGAITLGYFLLFCFLLFFQFQVILFNNALVVKNGICPFGKTKVYYKDIVEVKIIYLGGYTMPYMQIITGKTKLAWR